MIPYTNLDTAGLELIDGHRRPWPSVPLLLAVMPLKILGYLRPKKGALFPLGRDALAVLCVPFCVAVMPFFQRLVLPFFHFEYSNNFLPIGIQIFEWTENCDPLIHSAEEKCKTKINNRKVTKLPTAKLIEIAVANCIHGHNFIEILHVSCTKASPIFSGWKICIHHWSLLSGIHTESAIASYWLGSVMNHNRSEGKFLWFPPTNPSQENGKSPKFSNNHYKMSKTLHILNHEC